MEGAPRNLIIIKFFLLGLGYTQENLYQIKICTHIEVNTIFSDMLNWVTENEFNSLLQSKFNLQLATIDGRDYLFKINKLDI